MLPLCKKLNDECIEVREAITIALASLAQLKQGKVEVKFYFFFYFPFRCLKIITFNK